MPLSTDVLCDLLGFLDRNSLDKCQLVCREWDELIELNPESFKQRRRFYCLHINHFHNYIFTDYWSSPPLAAANCCKEELKAMADSMDGTLLMANNRQDQDFSIRMTLSPPTTTKPSTQLTTSNRLTPTTAFKFLNSLKHLNGCLIENIFIDREVKLSFSTLFPSFTLHCHRLNIEDISELQQLTAAFKPKEVKCGVNDNQIGSAIDRIRSYGPMPFSIVLEVWWSRREELDGVMEFFHLNDVSSTAISQVRLRLYYSDWNNWPMTPFNAAIDINEEQEGKRVYIRTNQQSRKIYRVVVERNRQFNNKVGMVIIEM